MIYHTPKQFDQLIKIVKFILCNNSRNYIMANSPSINTLARIHIIFSNDIRKA